jgi:hypothetical protein
MGVGKPPKTFLMQIYIIYLTSANILPRKYYPYSSKLQNPLRGRKRFFVELT